MKITKIKKQLIFYTILIVLFMAILSGASVMFEFFGLPLQGFLIFLAVLLIAFGICTVYVYKGMTNIFTVIGKVSKSAWDITKGKPVEVYKHYKKDELGELADSVEALLDYIHERVYYLDKINEGDYSQALEPRGDGDRLSFAIRRVVDTNNEILHKIKKASAEIYSMSAEVSGSASALASGSTEQAATMEQFVAVTSEVREASDHNAELANLTLERALNSKTLMIKSNEERKQLANAMEAINASSKRIETVTKVIDEIAFQTNILALNAAVEAARAGVHGKGFAVVADEVRELASKSAAAAKETAELIQMSIRAIQEGDALVRLSEESLADVGVDAEKASEYMIELKASSEHQRVSLSEINHGVNQISNVVQSNSALAQNNAMIAQMMSEQSEKLETLVSIYKLRDEQY